MYVLDSSVAAKWFFSPAEETLVIEARRLLADYAGGKLHLLVLDLFWTEMGNLLWKSARRGRISPKSAGEAMDTLLETNIPTIRSQPLLKDALAIATRFSTDSLRRPVRGAGFHPGGAFGDGRRASGERPGGARPGALAGCAVGARKAPVQTHRALGACFSSGTMTNCSKRRSKARPMK